MYMVFGVVLRMAFAKINKLWFFLSCNTFSFYAESKKKHYKNILLSNQPVSFDMYLISFSKLFLYLYQIQTFNKNLSDEEMLISHLIWCVNYIAKI